MLKFFFYIYFTQAHAMKMFNRVISTFLLPVYRESKHKKCRLERGGACEFDFYWGKHLYPPPCMHTQIRRFNEKTRTQL